MDNLNYILKKTILHLFVPIQWNHANEGHCWPCSSKLSLMEFYCFSVGQNLTQSSAVFNCQPHICLFPSLCRSLFKTRANAHFWMLAYILLLPEIFAKVIKNATWCYMPFWLLFLLLFPYCQGKHCANANRKKLKKTFQLLETAYRLVIITSLI